MNTTNLALARALTPQLHLSDHDHDALLENDRATYTALLASNATSTTTAVGILARLLAVTDGPRDLVRENRLIAQALADLPVADVIAGFSELARKKINNQRTSGVIRSYLFGAPDLEKIVVHHRRAVRRILTHAMGRGVSAAIARIAATPPSERTESENRSLAKHVTRYAKAAEIAVPCVAFVFGHDVTPPTKDGPIAKYQGAKTNLEKGAGLPYATLRGIASTYHKNAPRHVVPRLAVSARVKRHIDEAAELSDTSLVGVLKRLYKTREIALFDEVEQALQTAIAPLPRLDLNVAMIVDASASMRGVGHREFSALAIAEAIRLVIEKRTIASRVTWIGARPEPNGLVTPSGATELAPAMVAAAVESPDAVLVISDGYENVESGDAKRTLDALRGLGVDVPFVHVLPAFTVREHVEDRQPLGADNTILETGENGFVPLVLRLAARVAPQALPSILEALVEKEEVQP